MISNNILLSIFAISLLGIGIMSAYAQENELERTLMMNESMQSPHKQMTMGIDPHKIQCKSEHQIVFKASDWSPACVKSSSVEKLIQRGWAANHDATHAMMDEKMMDEKMMDEKMMDEKMMDGFDTSMAAPIEGSVNAPVTIIEFGDYQCPKCQQWFQNVKPVLSNDYIDSGIVKLYFVDFAFFGDDSVSAAQATYCAEDQGKYKEYHGHLYNNQKGINDGWANPENLKSVAAELGLDTEIFDECLDSGKYSERVAFNTSVGAKNNVEGTPAFFIISSEGMVERIDGPQPATVFSNVIEELR